MAEGQCDAHTVTLGADEGATLYCHSLSQAIEKLYTEAQKGAPVRGHVFMCGIPLRARTSGERACLIRCWLNSALHTENASCPVRYAY